MGKEMLFDPTPEWRSNAKTAAMKDAEEERVKAELNDDGMRKMSLFSRRGEDNLALELDD